ncbi:MAG: alpha/beta hydrolase fold domain-containing protein [Clostridia bacterium]|nr:alpha/beta hydrolase fold domain-containing protein [Clostridia bacterium]
MTERGLSYGPLPAHKLDFYPTASPDRSPLFVFFHGGGLEGGDRGNGSDPVFTELSRRGISVATADSRMYPAARFPDFVADAARCTVWCKRNLPHRGLVIGGSSAGGYLSMMLALAGDYLAVWGVDHQDKRAIAGYFCDSGQPTVHFNILRERGLDTRLIRIDEAAPLWHVKPVTNPGKLPRVALIVADNDMENRLEQNRLLHRTMIHLGWPLEKVPFTLMEGYGHTGYTYAAAPDGSLVYPPMVEAFVRASCEAAENA